MIVKEMIFNNESYNYISGNDIFGRGYIPILDRLDVAEQAIAYLIKENKQLRQQLWQEKKDSLYISD